jgi:FtsH-binding integral membrane protein
MAKKSRTYIWQFVIGLGFLSGLWTAIGIDPQAVIIDVLGNAVDTVYSDPAIRSLFLILPTILLLISTLGAYRKGRTPGLISVIIAYIAGLFILVSTVTALILLGVAIFIGYLAPRRSLVKKNDSFLTFTLYIQEKPVI